MRLYMITLLVLQTILLPGAHRLKISLELKEFALNAITDKNFIQLLNVSRGQIQSKISSTDFSVLEQTLARRTFDEW